MGTDFSQRFIGLVRPVLWERARKKDLMSGFTDNYIKVLRPYDPGRAGTVEAVRA